ncbi:gamma-parvin isoform X1 [Carcharodon carcharias]|uniref:gamma-parvin isoform X1 n=1 Tax=Carcharodon carcharias TaxID=13397 RepID=UPI001B7F66CE|nr:gamma-parvin isoform X1 [Carcharodon carcharias]
MDSSIPNLVTAYEEFKSSTEIDIAPGERRKIIHPNSLKSSKFEELITFLIDWINATLKQDHIVVQSLEEDLYDGLVLHHLLAHLGNIKLHVEEIALSTNAQKQKLSIILDTANQLLQVTEDDNLNWSTELIHKKDLISTLHLLVAIAKHFKPDIPLPQNVCVETLILEIDKTGIKTVKHLEYITEKSDDTEQEQIPEADGINDLFKLGPDKVKIVQQAMLHFTNKHLGSLGVVVKDLNTQWLSPSPAYPTWISTEIPSLMFRTHPGLQFSNGVILVLLIGQLEGYFIHLSEYFLNPSCQKEKLHNVTFVLELLKERGLLKYPVNPEDIVNLDSKATIRILHCLFAKYKDK